MQEMQELRAFFPSEVNLRKEIVTPLKKSKLCEKVDSTGNRIPYNHSILSQIKKKLSVDLLGCDEISSFIYAILRLLVYEIHGKQRHDPFRGC